MKQTKELFDEINIHAERIAGCLAELHKQETTTEQHSRLESATSEKKLETVF